MRKVFTILFLLGNFVLRGGNISANDIALLIKNYNSIKPPQQVDIADAVKILADQKPDGSFKSVGYADRTRGQWTGMQHWRNLHTLVGAWHATSDTRYRKAVIAGLNYWAAALPDNPNWWWQYIGVPLHLITVLNNMYGEIPPATLAALRKCFDRSSNYSRSGRMYTGQNLFNTALIQMWKGIYYNDPHLLHDEGLKHIFSVIRLAGNKEEGIQKDWSFHQHGPQQQFGNYGQEYLVNCLTVLAMFKGTSFALPPEKESIIRNYFFNGMRWTFFKKQMDILACGRQLIYDMPRRKYERIAAAVKNFNAADRKKAEAFFACDDLLSGSNYFFCSDYLIHRRKDFYFSFKMSSNRVTGAESTNKENMQGLYLGYGVMQYKISGDEYDGMTGLWDWRKLPGLTAVYDNAPLKAAGRIGNNRATAVGGVSDKKNSGCMMNLDTDKLNFNKSVAVFGKKVVFNLSEVKNNTKFPVHTTIDSRRYTVPVEVYANGRKTVYTDGSCKLSQVSGIVCGNTAYTFPIPTDLTLAIEDKTVAWNTVTIWAKGNVSGKTVTISVEGTQPLNYIVSPAKEKVDTINSTVKPGIHVVTDKDSGIKYLFFFAPGTYDIPEIGHVSCDRKAAVMLTGETVILSDVEQTGKAVHFTLNGKSYINK